MSDAVTEPADTPRAPVLVVGVGSELRTDDAAGRRVVEVVAALGLHGVEVRSAHQLTPELAADIVGRRLVIIVDASVEVSRVTVRRADPSENPGVVSHHIDVGALVAMAELLGQAPAQVVTVAIPAHDLALGTELSSTTAQAVLAAVERVRLLVEETLPQDLTGL